MPLNGLIWEILFSLIYLEKPSPAELFNIEGGYLEDASEVERERPSSGNSSWVRMMGSLLPLARVSLQTLWLRKQRAIVCFDKKGQLFPVQQLA